MKVKICGITNSDDAGMCEDLGADALGFVHVAGRGRSRPLKEVSEMCRSLGLTTMKVLVCAPADVHDAERMFIESGADILQVHSLEPDQLDILRSEGIKVMRSVRPDRAEASKYAPHSDFLVFESSTPGTGSAYDYSKVPSDFCDRGFIAGGLNIGNMASALRMKPYGLDVSSGVEVVPGRKDRALVSEFIRRCRA